MNDKVEKIVIYILLYTAIALVSFLLVKQFYISIELKSKPLVQNLTLVAMNEVSTKSFSLILISFLVILIGAVVIIKGVEAAYKLNVEQDKWKSSLETASPGLVMVSLGCALIGFCIFKTYDIKIGVPNSQSTGVNSVVSAIRPTEMSSFSILQDHAARPISIPARSTKNNVTQAELDWAINLQNMLAGGYSPNVQEQEAYTDIYNRYEKSHTVEPTKTKKNEYQKLTQEEVAWALSLEKKVNLGYKPTDAELQIYQQIALRLDTMQKNK